MFVVVSDIPDFADPIEAAFVSTVPITKETIREFKWRLSCRDFEGVTAILFDITVKQNDTLAIIDETVRLRRSAYLFAVVPENSVILAGDLAHHGVDRCLPQTAGPRMIREILLDTFSRYRTMSSIVRDVPELQSVLVGRSKIMQLLRDRVRRFAQSSDPVLITGETGVGKDVVARAIHSLSPRRDGPFQSVNVTAIVDSLFESELFGSRKGAYTGAFDSPGIIGESDGGSLFLDEIGDLATPLQPKLLRVIEMGQIRPVGAPKPIPVSVRVISATNRNLGLLVRAGTFRRDLWHRLTALRIAIPPLREHIEDIEELAYHLLERNGNEDVRLTPGVVRCFHHYPWPGNVRELGTVLARAIMNSDGSLIRTRHIEIDEESTTEGPEFRIREGPEPADLPGLLPD